jgi:hypothetical protein
MIVQVVELGLIKKDGVDQETVLGALDLATPKLVESLTAFKERISAKKSDILVELRSNALFSTYLTPVLVMIIEGLTQKLKYLMPKPKKNKSEKFEKV